MPQQNGLLSPLHRHRDPGAEVTLGDLVRRIQIELVDRAGGLVAVQAEPGE